MQQVENIVFDGSYCYETGTIGLGIVLLNQDFSPARVFSHSAQLTPDRRDSDFVKKYGNLLAELAAAKFALDKIEPNSTVHLFGDSNDIVTTVNGFSTVLRKPAFAAAVRCLRTSIRKHASVKAFRVATLDADHIPENAIAIAHNASALASGSVKIVKTPDYDGPYSHRKILFGGLPQAEFERRIDRNDLMAFDSLRTKRIKSYKPQVSA